MTGDIEIENGIWVNLEAASPAEIEQAAGLCVRRAVAQLSFARELVGELGATVATSWLRLALAFAEPLMERQAQADAD
jgi:hypothetical protein